MTWCCMLYGTGGNVLRVESIAAAAAASALLASAEGRGGGGGEEEAEKQCSVVAAAATPCGAQPGPAGQHTAAAGTNGERGMLKPFPV